MSILYVIFMYASWSSVFSIGKWTLQYAPPIFLTGSRMVLAAIILLSYLLVRRKESFRLKGKQLLSLLVLAIFSIYLTNILEFWGLQYLSSAKTCFIYSLSPFFAALFSYIHFGEKMNKRKWMGLGLGFLGFIPVLAMQSGSENLYEVFSFLSLPDLAIMGAALFSVYGWVLLRLLVKDSPEEKGQSVSPMMANGISMLFGGMMALTHSFFIDSWTPVPVAMDALAPFAKGTLIMTVISNLICYNLYGFLLRKYTATFLSFMGLLSPIFASLNGWLILGEKPSWIIFASTALVGIGLWILYRAELKQGYILSKKPKEPVQEQVSVS